jgi:alkylhydroperoxidase/carboxymuconolactone decarboxylase family protein YurZ
VDHTEILRRLAIGDTSFLSTANSDRADNPADHVLDPRTCAFARLGAAVAVAASPSGFQNHVDAALMAGATESEIVDVLIAVVPCVGMTRVVSAAPALGLAIGYDSEAALARLDPTDEEV